MFLKMLPVQVTNSVTVPHYFQLHPYVPATMLLVLWGKRVAKFRGMPTETVFCMWVSAGFPGFLLPLKNMPVGHLGVDVCPKRAVLDRHPVQGVYPPRGQRSWDQLLSRCGSDQDKELTELECRHK